MSGNAKNYGQRLKILYLYKLLLEKTDEEHPLTMPEIISELERCGISAGRKALYEDIEALRLFGLDIVSLRGSTSGYFVAERDFQLPELKLLADAVCSSRFLTEKKSGELLKKLERLSSVYQAKQLQRQVYVADRVKSMNERIYINVDVIHRAISLGRQISFSYFKYDTRKKRNYGGGARICSPYAMVWEDERYYLIAYYEKYGQVSNFRVDRMEDISITETPAVPCPDGFNISGYVSSSFSMFSGETREVKLRFDNELVSAVIDRFGTGVRISGDSEGRFTVKVSVKAEQPFFAWIFKFGKKAEILEPEDIRGRYREMLSEVMENYGDNYSKRH